MAPILMTLSDLERSLQRF